MNWRFKKRKEIHTTLFDCWNVYSSSVLIYKLTEKNSNINFDKKNIFLLRKLKTYFRKLEFRIEFRCINFNDG